MKPRIVEIIIDGYGYNPELEIEISRTVFSNLPPQANEQFNGVFGELGKDGDGVSPELAFILLFGRNWLGMYYDKDTKEKVKGMSSDSLAAFRRKRTEIQGTRPALCEEMNRMIAEVSAEKHYAVWAARTPFLDGLREKYPSASTKASGIEAGYEDLRPEVQGNSETGHQQLGNFTVAPQVPLEIAIEIEDGRFYENPVLNEAIEKAKAKNGNLNVTFMISGEYGDDGRVHSCWNHLESFLELLFDRHGFDPKKFRLQAILDGRDAPLKSSIEKDGEKLGFLYKLKDLMRSHDALDSVAWIVGRGIAMDRDYEEERTKADYKLLVEGEGIEAGGFDEAVEMVRDFHGKKVFDPFVQPIAVKDRDGAIRRIEPGDVVVDLNFRADRQRARIAALLNAREFLNKEAGKKGKTWKMDWMKKDLNLSVYCITEYHPDLADCGAKIVYQIKPQPHNFLPIVTSCFKKAGKPFKYLLAAESTKAVHMGYFIKGRRETIEHQDCESRIIVASYGREHGILTDDDYYKTPQMKAFEVAGKVMNEFALGICDLAIMNFSNPDMLGHLVNEHFSEGVKALEYLDGIVEALVKFALKEKAYAIITSDHGNIEDFSSSHSLNHIVTTFVSSGNDIVLKKAPDDPIKPFDIPWAIVELLGISSEIRETMPEIPEWIVKKGLVGKSPIERTC